MANIEEKNINTTQEAQPQGTFQRGRGGNSENRDNRSPRPPRREREPKEDDGLIKKTVAVNRVTKVVQGGRTMRFSALVVCGDGKGKVGIGMGKAAEVPQAIDKATQQAKRSMVDISITGTTIPHEIYGKFGRGYVLMLPAPSGTGAIAGGAVRVVLEACGIKDIYTKSYGTNNPINCAKATINALTSLRSAEQVAALRGKTVEEILG